MPLDKVVPALILIIASLRLLAYDLTGHNFSYQYDVTDYVKVNHRVVGTSDGLDVYFSIKTDSIKRWELDILQQQHYNSTTHDTLTLSTLDTIQITSYSGLFRLSLTKPKLSLLLITLKNSKNPVMRIEDIRVSSPVGFPSALPLDAQGLPLLKSYVTDQQFTVLSEDNPLHAYRYIDDFGPSDPPMGIMKPIAPSLESDTSFYFNEQLNGLTDYYFYLIQSDSLAENAITILKCPSYFPDFKKLDELIDPLTYITTMQEIETIRSSKSKSAFDHFWLSTYSNKSAAKEAIRFFYNRVENANMLYTDYKVGWKTDRGMIYIIYGKPDRVMRTERSETWVYNDDTKFEFIRISTLFAPMMCILKRDRSYERLWYAQVGKIRKGF